MALLLIVPGFVLFAVFYLGPSLTGLYLSLHEWDGIAVDMTYVGLDNYGRLLGDERFWGALVINWIVALSSLVIQVPVAIALAVAVARKSRASSLYRTSIFLPQILSVAAVAIMWVLIYDPYTGLLNSVLSDVLGLFGQPPINLAWLGESETALAAAVIATTWYGIGLTMMLFLAGVGGIPPEYIDAARLETNSQLARLRYVTLPMLREVLLIVFVLVISGSFGQLAGFFLLLTGGGPSGHTEVLGLYMLDSGLKAMQFGYASAISVVLVLIVLLAVIVPVVRIARTRLEY
jgi:ABC-type sugar transport system permease subunit